MTLECGQKTSRGIDPALPPQSKGTGTLSSHWVSECLPVEPVHLGYQLSSLYIITDWYSARITADGHGAASLWATHLQRQASGFGVTAIAGTLAGQLLAS